MIMCASDMMDWEEIIVVLFVSDIVFKSVGCFLLFFSFPSFFPVLVALRLCARQMFSP